MRICEKCKTTAEQMLKSGFFGCAQCYDTFELTIFLTAIHGASKHIGKHSEGKKFLPSISEQALENIAKLKLEAAVKKENYEHAGVIKTKLDEWNAAKTRIASLSQIIEYTEQGDTKTRLENELGQYKDSQNKIREFLLYLV